MKRLKSRAIRTLSITISLSFFLAGTTFAQPGQPSRQEQHVAVAVIGENVMESVELISPDQLADGYILWHQSDEIANNVMNYTLLLDQNGSVMHRWDTDLSSAGNTAYLLDSGGLLRMGVRDRSYVRGQPVVAADTLQITDRLGKPLWQLDAQDLDINGNKITFHHDMEPMANGNILVLIYEEIDPEQAVAAGWTAGQGDTVWSDGIMEIQPNLEDGSYEVVWQWRFIDHIVQDQDKTAPNYGIVANNPGKIDAHFPRTYAPMNAVRQHLNSIDYHPELDQILISAFIYNEIWVIDHSSDTEAASGKAGDVLFRYGNPAVYDMGSDDDRLFSKQHDANWVDAGLPGADNILVFNNNTDLSGLPGGGLNMLREGGGTAAALAQEQLRGVSNLHEIRPALNADGAYVRPNDQPFDVEQIWLWEHPDFFAPFQGGARRLPNGNTLISDTVGRRVWELSETGETLAKYKGPAPTYKSFKYTEEQLSFLLGNK